MEFIKGCLTIKRNTDNSSIYELTGHLKSYGENEYFKIDLPYAEETAEILLTKASQYGIDLKTVIVSENDINNLFGFSFA